MAAEAAREASLRSAEAAFELEDVLRSGAPLQPALCEALLSLDAAAAALEEARLTLVRACGSDLSD